MLNDLKERLITERKVRAVAEVGSAGTPQAWAGSLSTLLVFERSLNAPRRQTEDAVQLVYWPYQALEDWQSWDALQHSDAPLGLLASGRELYDPTGLLSKIQRILGQLTEPQLAAYRQMLLQQAATRLTNAEALLLGSGVTGQLLALTETRRIAMTCLYPALLTHLHLWPSTGLRAPHHWQAQAGLAFPKAAYHLGQLYGFGAEPEARRLLLATRGMNLVQAEKRARVAVQAGYYDGAVRYLRDETAAAWQADLERWMYLSSARQSKLTTLLGAEVSPLGPVALALGRELLEDVKAGR